MTTWGPGDPPNDAGANQPPPYATGQSQPPPYGPGQSQPASNWPAYGQPPPGAGQPQQGWPAWGQQGPVQPGTDGLAIASLVLGIVGFFGAGICAILAVIFGPVALNRISKTGRAGRGMAIAGTILGGFWLLLIIVIVIAVVSSSGSNS